MKKKILYNNKKEALNWLEKNPNSKGLKYWATMDYLKNQHKVQKQGYKMHDIIDFIDMDRVVRCFKQALNSVYGLKARTHIIDESHI